MAVIFIDGFDKYAIPSQNNISADSTFVMGPWTTRSQTVTLVTGLSATGYAMAQSVTTATCSITRTLPSRSYTRLIGGGRCKVSALNAPCMGVQFVQDGTALCTITASNTGTISLRTGGNGGTALSTSTAAIIAATAFYIEWDITFGASSAYTVYLNGLQIFSSTGNTGNGQTTCGVFTLLGSANSGTVTWDDVYLFDSTGSFCNSVLLTNPRIETRSPTGDNQTQWTNAGNLLIPTGLTGGMTTPTTNTSTTNSPGANQLALMQITPGVNCNLQSVNLMPAGSSTTAKYKAVLYSNSAPAATPTLAAGNLTLSNGNLTFAAPSGSWLSNESNGSARSGTCYFECTTGSGVAVPSGANGSVAVAVLDGSAGLGTWLGSDTHAVGFFNDNRILTGGGSGGSWQGAGPNKVIGIAVDFTNRKIWAANITDAPTNWNGSTSNNPATGVGGISFNAGMTTPYFIGVSAITAGVGSGTLNFGATSYTGTPPSGFGNLTFTESTPNTLVTTGTEVVGLTSGTVSTLPFGSGQSLTGGTSYWIGYITDTSVVLSEYDGSAQGQRKANTYGSGAPAGPLSGMTTGQASWLLWGLATGATTNWESVATSMAPSGQTGAADTGTITSTTANNEDLYTFPSLTNSGANAASNVYAVGVSLNVKKSDFGNRTAAAHLKSNATDSAGTTLAMSPSYGYIEGFYDSDPNGNIGWTPSAANSLKAGPKLVS